MADFGQLLQGLAVLLIVSGTFALIFRRIFLFFKGSASGGCQSGCSTCPSRCSTPRISADEDAVKIIPISELRQPKQH